MSKQPAIIFTVFLGSSALGALVGYKVAERRLGIQFEERLEKETKGMREFYTASTAKPYATPQEAVADLVPDVESVTEGVISSAVTAYNKVVASEGYNASFDVFEEKEVAPEVVKRNVFSDAVSGPEIPYVISQEDFMENSRGWEQVTVTYYKGDNVLTDDREDIIEEFENIIGNVAVVSFGLRSSDPRSVHVRNEKLGIDFEVILNESSYRQEVLGIDQPLPDLPSGRIRNDHP